MIYGKDLQAKLQFVNDDLLALGYDDTIQQAFNIGVNLKKGHNQEFPNDGLQSNNIVGNNLNSILYPSIFRQLFQSLSTDDSFSSISVTNVKQQVADANFPKDCVQLELSAQTRLNETVQDFILI